MSGITLEFAQSMLDAYLEALRCDPSGNLSTVSIAGRTVTYKSADDLIKWISFWESRVAELSPVPVYSGSARYVLPNFGGPSRGRFG